MSFYQQFLAGHPPEQLISTFKHYLTIRRYKIDPDHHITLTPWSEYDLVKFSAPDTMLSWNLAGYLVGYEFIDLTTGKKYKNTGKYRDGNCFKYIGVDKHFAEGWIGRDITKPGWVIHVEEVL